MPTLSTAHDPRRDVACGHGVRWPHECKDCEEKGIQPEDTDNVYLLRGHIETQRSLLRQVLAVLDVSVEGQHLLLREQIRALVHP